MINIIRDDLRNIKEALQNMRNYINDAQTEISVAVEVYENLQQKISVSCT